MSNQYTFSSMEERFWSKVNKEGPVYKDLGNCWEWTACDRNKKGYGNFKLKNKSYSAHKMSWIIHFGIVPNKICVLHKCDNRKCVNPDHLFLGTIKDNNKDRDEKNRHWTHKGENCTFSKLTEIQVKEIRKKYTPKVYTFKMLAKEYNVNFTTIFDVVRYRSWKHI